MYRLSLQSSLFSKRPIGEPTGLDDWLNAPMLYRSQWSPGQLYWVLSRPIHQNSNHNLVTRYLGRPSSLLWGLRLCNFFFETGAKPNLQVTKTVYSVSTIRSSHHQAVIRSKKPHNKTFFLKKSCNCFRNCNFRIILFIFLLFLLMLITSKLITYLVTAINNFKFTDKCVIFLKKTFI